jgi:hypothetical protein
MITPDMLKDLIGKTIIGIEMPDDDLHIMFDNGQRLEISVDGFYDGEGVYHDASWLLKYEVKNANSE